VLIESLPDQRLDNSLAAYIEILSCPVEFLQHAGSDVHINALNRLDHSALTPEETGNILALFGQPGNCISGNRFFRGLTSVLHTIGFPVLSTSKV